MTLLALVPDRVQAPESDENGSSTVSTPSAKPPFTSPPPGKIPTWNT